MNRFVARAVSLLGLLLIAAGTGLAATASEFYLAMLRRGISSYESGRFDAAAKELDVASFGLIESVDHFETAKVYAALAHDKVGNAVQARAAAQRVLAAERVQRRFSQISLPGEVRTAFVGVARKLLTAPEVAALTSNAPVPTATPREQPRVTTPGTRTTPPATAPQTPPQTQPQVQPQPAQPQPQPSQSQSQAQAPAPKPQPQKVDPPKVDPPKVDPPKPEPPKPEPPKPQPQTVQPPKVIEERTVPFTPPQPQPQPQQSAARPAPAPANATSRLAEAERLLAATNLPGARAIYRELIETNLDRASALAIAEGSYRARDFTTSIRAFDRVGALNKGEEPYRYYLAVALYETGNYVRAKRELTAALPFIEVTDSVARYRAKIEGAIH